MLDHFTADVHANRARAFFSLEKVAPLVKSRESDLGQYIFLKAQVNDRPPPTQRPAWLYRSYPEGELA